MKLKSLKRVCRACKLPHPSQTSLKMIRDQLKICAESIKDLEPTAPQIRKDFLVSRLEHHIKEGNDDDAEEVRRRIAREGQKKYRRICKKFGARKSLPASKVATRCEDGGRVVHASKLDTHAAIKSHLKPRFQTACDAPISRGQLRRDLGHLADTPAAKAILEGKYVFPPGTDEATIMILQAAAEVYSNNKNVIRLILRHKDFLYWRTARERTESSPSTLHFGHSMAQSFSARLTRLKLLQLNVVLKLGEPLERWLNGLTVMLEKERGNINIEKLRAICLFEADLNWVLKVIYAKRTMKNARNQNLIEPELFAVAGQSAPNATMAKIMFTDVCRTQHRNFAVASVDLGQCYDAVNHAFCSIALQAFGVPLKAIRLMLLTLQTMKFWLKTAFGVDDDPFGGTPLDPCYGLSQ